MAKLELITAEVCPFAQRSHMALLEKGLEFERREVDLRNKPKWFEEVSPYSKVPVLRDGDVRVYESTIINEYLEEVFPQPHLMPTDPGARANARIWIDFDNVKFIPTFYRILLAQDGPRRRELAETLVDHMTFLEKEGFAKASQGPYWFGPDISLVDLAFYPHFERFPAMTEYRGVEIPESCGQLKAWIEVMAERPSSKATAHDADYHINAYAHYADGTASGTTARDMRA